MRCGFFTSSILDYVAISWGFQLDTDPGAGPRHVGLTPEQMHPMIPEKTLNSGLSPQNFLEFIFHYLWIFHMEPLWLMFHRIRIILLQRFIYCLCCILSMRCPPFTNQDSGPYSRSRESPFSEPYYEVTLMLPELRYKLLDIIFILTWFHCVKLLIKSYIAILSFYFY